MKFQLPQFIETETKIIGPLTLKQFLWVAAGGAVVFALFAVIKGVAALLLSIPIVAISMAFAFLKINNVPLINYISYALSYFLSPKKYLYRDQAEQQKQNEIQFPTQKQ